LKDADGEAKFAKVLAEVLESCQQGKQIDLGNNPSLREYRWIPGHTGVVSF
jgi:hypothetical protein